MNKFEVLVSITDVNKFSELIFDILNDKKSAEEIETFLSEEFSEKGLQTLKSVAQSGYPLSFVSRNLQVKLEHLFEKPVEIYRTECYNRNVTNMYLIGGDCIER